MSEEDYDPNERIKARYDMTDGLVALFEAFMLKKDYAEALNVICDCYLIAPTSFVIREVIFKIMMTCDAKLCNESLDYLEQSLKFMPTDDDHKYIFIEGLKDEGGDVWGAFNHFVLSCLHHRKIMDGYVSLHEYVKSPNCDYLVQIYVHAFIKGPFKSSVFGSNSEEKFSALMKWINIYYKKNTDVDEVLQNLHLLLDHIFELELSSDPAIPKYAAIHKAFISKYLLILLSSCKDVFRSIENQQRFFNLTESSYLILKICQHRLDDMLEKEPVPQNSVMTLKSIIDDYFFDQPKDNSQKPVEIEETIEIKKEEKTPSKSKRGRKSKAHSKDPMLAGMKSRKKCNGDTDFHVCCRSNRPDDLLEALYSDQNKDVNAKNSFGLTPLHEACLADSYLCCKFLIDEADVREVVVRKVDFRAIDNEGRTPLHFAVYKKGLDVVKLLINRGGGDLVKIHDHKGKKPIDYSESKEISEILLDTEAQLKPSDEESQRNPVLVQQKLPTLKNPENLPLFLQTLRTLLETYCEIYEIPKGEGVIEMLTHCNEECYHYKASLKGTFCEEDSTALVTVNENIEKLFECAKHISAEVNIAKELRGLKIAFAALF